MILFDKILAEKESWRLKYMLAKPFPHIVLDDICDAEKLTKMLHEIPELEQKSRDYVFANNKFEKANYGALGPYSKELYDDLSSEKMNEFLSFISNEVVFVDPKNHGGGLHQGKKYSFLDMHLDFNYHPIHKLWYRNMNLLLYLNKDWKEEYGGQLVLQDLRSGEQDAIAVPFNRLIIQQTRNYTLHGYHRTNFPDGMYRLSIATYAYTEHLHHIEKPRTTDWHPSEEAGWMKKFFAKHYDTAVQTKNKLFGIGTSKNQ